MTDDPPGDVPDFIPPPPPPGRPTRAEPLRAQRIEPTAPIPPAQPSAPAPSAPAVARRSLVDWLGPRGVRRPEPRLGVTLAGAGSVLLVVGALAVSGDSLAGPSSGGGGSQFPGLFITLAVIVAGVALVATHRHGPLAAAGVAASATALPPFVFFLTFSKSSPTAFSTILFVSTAGWLLAYAVGPGRGHNFYLGAALIGLWLWFIEVTEHLFSSPLAVLSFSTANSLGENSIPDATTIGLYTLGFAAVYVVVGRVLDRRNIRGAATPFAFAGVVTIIIGISALSDDLEQIGTGLAFAGAGLLLCYLGATESRRATSWTGAVLVSIGVTAAVAEPFDSATSFGIAEIIVGGLVILVAHWIATQFREPPETDAVLSRFYNVGSVQPSGPPPPPAGSVLG